MAGPESTTILVVDDERGPRESLRMILSPGHRVLCAADGMEALEILRTTAVDLVTLDLNMPGVKGDQLMRTIREEFPELEIIVITGYGSLETATEALRVGICDYLQKPFDVVQVSAAVLRALSRRRGRSHLVGFLRNLGQVVGFDREVSGLVQSLERSPRLNRRVGDLLENMGWAAEYAAGAAEPARTMDFLEVLAETIESQNPYLRGHARRVAFYAGLLGERICLSAEELERVRIGAFLHDLGKIGVPTDLLMRASALAPAERALVERHPEIGARLVEPLALATGLTSAIRHHHEWWDGRGYPDGLHGETIPLAARVIGIADAYDAMSSDRPYRRALSPLAIRAEFERFAGVQFDPALTKDFLSILETGLGDGDLAVVADAVTDVARPRPQAAA
jgi:response regulator RpfG family c-di-GMP phosphodiesterase